MEIGGRLRHHRKVWSRNEDEHAFNTEGDPSLTLLLPTRLYPRDHAHHYRTLATNHGTLLRVSYGHVLIGMGSVNLQEATPFPHKNHIVVAYKHHCFSFIDCHGSIPHRWPIHPQTWFPSNRAHSRQNPGKFTSFSLILSCSDRFSLRGDQVPSTVKSNRSWEPLLSTELYRRHW